MRLFLLNVKFDFLVLQHFLEHHCYSDSGLWLNLCKSNIRCQVLIYIVWLLFAIHHQISIFFVIPSVGSVLGSLDSHFGNFSNFSSTAHIERLLGKIEEACRLVYFMSQHRRRLPPSTIKSVTRKLLVFWLTFEFQRKQGEK